MEPSISRSASRPSPRRRARSPRWPACPEIAASMSMLDGLVEEIDGESDPPPHGDGGPGGERACVKLLRRTADAAEIGGRGGMRERRGGERLDHRGGQPAGTEVVGVHL